MKLTSGIKSWNGELSSGLYSTLTATMLFATGKLIPPSCAAFGYLLLVTWILTMVSPAGTVPKNFNKDNFLQIKLADLKLLKASYPKFGRLI